MQPAVPRLLLLIFLALAAPTAAAPGLFTTSALPAAAAAAELRAAQERTNRALVVRKARLDAWRTTAVARDEAAATVARLKKDGAPRSGLEGALRTALARDEAAARARSALSAAEAQVARDGAELLRLYDAVLLERRRVVDSHPLQDPRRRDAVAQYRTLAAQRDAVRQALLPALRDDQQAPLGPVRMDLQPAADDDVETLLEKADLARDLEDRYRRRADAVLSRLRELEEEAAVARDVVGLVQRGQLFDEEDRRLLVVRPDLQNARATGLPGTAAGAPQSRGGSVAPRENSNAPNEAAPAPPPRAPDADDGFFEADPSAQGRGNDVVPTPPALVTAPPPAPAATPGTAERAFSAGNDAALQAWMATGTSVEELRALEKKLRSEAKRLQGQQTELKKEAARRAR